MDPHTAHSDRCLSLNPDTIHSDSHTKNPAKSLLYNTQGIKKPANQLQVTPITLYQSTRASDTGKLICVSDQFIVYPIRNGLIRVISQTSVSRCLLRKHEHHFVTELAFFNPQSEYLLSVGTDHRIIVWRIQSDPLAFEVAKVIACHAQRVKWFTANRNRIGIACDSKVHVLDLDLVDALGSTVDFSECSITCVHFESEVYDFLFSEDGGNVVTCASDGLVCIWRIRGLTNGQNAEFVHRFEPFMNFDVSSVFLASSQGQSVLVFGGEGNRQLALWNTAFEESNHPVCYQTLQLEQGEKESESRNVKILKEITLDPLSDLVFVADRTKSVLCVFHIGQNIGLNGEKIRCFDSVAEFPLAYPILSMEIHHVSTPASLFEETAVSDTSDLMIHLYCVQTEAIQRYNVHQSVCNVPISCASIVLQNDKTAHDESVKELQVSKSIEEKSEQVPIGDPLPCPSLMVSDEPVQELFMSAETPQFLLGYKESDSARQPQRDESCPPKSPPSLPETVRLETNIKSINLQELSDNRSLRFSPFSPRSIAHTSPSSSARACRDDASTAHMEVGNGHVSNDVDTDAIMSMLAQMEARQVQREQALFDQQRQFLENFTDSLEGQIGTFIERAINRQIQSVLVPAMGRIVLHTMENNFMEPIRSDMQRFLSEVFLPLMQKNVSASVAEMLPGVLTTGMNDMVVKVVEDVRRPVRESFRECFQDIIIPSFQAATQKMFEQINETFVKGTKNALDTSSKGQHALESIQTQIQQLCDQLDAVFRQVCSTSAQKILEQRVTSPEETIKELLDAENYEQAFQVALGAQNVQLVVFACQNADPGIVLCSHAPKLSQMLILCLVQQLGAEVNEEFALKLDWIREALLVMNVDDESISTFVCNVLQELKQSLNQIPVEKRNSQFKLLHHILNSLVSSMESKLRL